VIPSDETAISSHKGNQCSEAARFTVDLDRTIKWAASRLLTQAGHRYGGQRSDRTADIWRPMVINHDIKNKAKAARYLPVYADYMQMEASQKPSDICRYMQVYAEKCRPVKSRQISAGISRYLQSAGICGSGKSRQIFAVRSGSLQVDLYLPRFWAASRIKDFIWPDCESEVRSAAGRAASEH